VPVPGTRQVEATDRPSGEWIGPAVGWESAPQVGVTKNPSFRQIF